MCRVVVPLAYNLFGDRVVQRGEGLVGELAKQVLGAVDFKGGHGLDWIGLDWIGLDWIGLDAFGCYYLFDFYFKTQSIFYITFQRKKYKRNVTLI